MITIKKNEVIARAAKNNETGYKKTRIYNLQDETEKELAEKRKNWLSFQYAEVKEVRIGVYKVYYLARFEV